MSTLTERWVNLRDREAVGDALSPAELAAVGEIEGIDPEVQAYVAQMRELETYLEGKHGEHPTTPDHQLVLRALSAVQLDSPSPRVQAIDHDRELARAADPEGPGWIRLAATSLSVGMTVAAALALIMYEPRSLRRGVPAKAATVAGPPLEAMVAAPKPKVEALLQVRTSERGARLRRGHTADVVLPGMLLGQGDRISSGEKVGCFVIEGHLEFCLAANSVTVLKALAENNLLLELERGHMSVHASAANPQRRFAVMADEVEVRAQSPVAFGLEATADKGVVRARVLRGRVRVSADAQSLEVGDLKSAVYRRDTRELDTVDLAPGPAQHEWELIGTGRLGASAAALWSTPDRAKASATEGDVEPALTAGAGQQQVQAPREMMQEAWELLKAERWQEAAEVYKRIADEAPESEESHIVLVRLGDLLLERLADPAGALVAFDRYLREGGGPLSAEARHGRITVFRRLGRAADERAAIDEFLRLHGKSTDAPSLEARLRVLSPEAP